MKEARILPSPLLQAIIAKDLEAFKDAFFDAKPEDKIAAIMKAKQMGAEEILEFCKDIINDINLLEDTLLVTLAAELGNIEDVRVLLDLGANIEGRPEEIDEDNPVNTPLYQASRSGHLAIAVLLIARGADVNSGFSTNYGVGGYTALHAAASAGYIDIVRLLLDKGAEVNKLNDYGETPLDVLYEEEGEEEIAELLIKKGAVVNKSTDDEESLSGDDASGSGGVGPEIVNIDNAYDSDFALGGDGSGGDEEKEVEHLAIKVFFEQKAPTKIPGKLIMSYKDSKGNFHNEQPGGISCEKVKFFQSQDGELIKLTPGANILESSNKGTFLIGCVEAISEEYKKDIKKFSKILNKLESSLVASKKRKIAEVDTDSDDETSETIIEEEGGAASAEAGPDGTKLADGIVTIKENFITLVTREIKEISLDLITKLAFFVGDVIKTAKQAYEEIMLVMEEDRSDSTNCNIDPVREGFEFYGNSSDLHDYQEVAVPRYDSFMTVSVKMDMPGGLMPEGLFGEVM